MCSHGYYSVTRNDPLSIPDACLGAEDDLMCGTVSGAGDGTIDDHCWGGMQHSPAVRVLSLPPWEPFPHSPQRRRSRSWRIPTCPANGLGETSRSQRERAVGYGGTITLRKACQPNQTNTTHSCKGSGRWYLQVHTSFQPANWAVSDARASDATKNNCSVPEFELPEAGDVRVEGQGEPPRSII